MTKTTRAVIAGCGAYLPERVVRNDDLGRDFGLETSDAWITERTGIKQRRIAAPGETASDMGAAAARQALERAGLGPDAVDAVIVATATPDSSFPATAAKIQAALGMTRGIAFDVSAACAGFVYALALAAESDESRSQAREEWEQARQALEDGRELAVGQRVELLEADDGGVPVVAPRGQEVVVDLARAEQDALRAVGFGVGDDPLEGARGEVF